MPSAGSPAGTKPGAGRGRAIVSVIIPTRDRLRYLMEAIASVQAQTFADWELIVVDDASRDETHSWLDTIADPRIRTSRSGTQVERSAARNRGLHEAEGEFVTFLDDDDRLRSRALELFADALKQDPTVALVCGGRIEFDDNGQRRRIAHVQWVHRRPLWPEILAGFGPGPGQVMFRTEKLRSIGGWDERIVGIEDWELVLRASYRLGPVLMHPYAGREWRKHPGQWTATYAPEELEVLPGVVSAFLAALSPEERSLGEGAVRMRTLFEEAQVTLHRRRNPAAALRLFIQSYRAAPKIAHSPMFAGRFIRGVAQSLLGALGGSRMERLLRAARTGVIHVLRRGPDHSRGESERGGIRTRYPPKDR